MLICHHDFLNDVVRDFQSPTLQSSSLPLAELMSLLINNHLSVNVWNQQHHHQQQQQQQQQLHGVSEQNRIRVLSMQTLCVFMQRVHTGAAAVA